MKIDHANISLRLEAGGCVCVCVGGGFQVMRVLMYGGEEGVTGYASANATL